MMKPTDLLSFFEPYIQNDRLLAALTGGELIDISADAASRALRMEVRFPKPVPFTAISDFAAEWVGHNLVYRLLGHREIGSADLEFAGDKRGAIRFLTGILRILGVG